jgi:K+-sensing histidine kinase KdpD
MAESRLEDRSDGINVAWGDIVRFIRQLSHDLRNHLNAIELQSAYISELDGDELKDEIVRLRGMVSGLTSALQTLSTAVSEAKPNFIPYQAADFAEDLRKKLGHDFPDQASMVTWNIQGADATLNVDPQLLQEALSEVLGNAFRYLRDKGNVVVAAKKEGGEFLFVIEEHNAQLEGATDNWGYQPFRTITANHYGLGLHRVRAIIEAHAGRMNAHYDSNASVLTTTLALPVSSDSSNDV